MKYTIEKTVTETIEVNNFPFYMKFGNWSFAKVCAENFVVHVGTSSVDTMWAIEIRNSIGGNDWQPCAPEEFYEAAAEAMRRINEPLGLEMHTLEPEGGAYVD